MGLEGEANRKSVFEPEEDAALHILPPVSQLLFKCDAFWSE